MACVGLLLLLLLVQVPQPPSVCSWGGCWRQQDRYSGLQAQPVLKRWDRIKAHICYRGLSVLPCCSSQLTLLNDRIPQSRGDCWTWDSKWQRCSRAPSFCHWQRLHYRSRLLFFHYL